MLQRSADGQAAIAAATAQAIAGDHGNYAGGRRDFENHGKSGVGKVDVALAVEGDTVRDYQLGGGGGPAVAGEDGIVPGVSIDGALGQHEAGGKQDGWQESFQNAHRRSLRLWLWPPGACQVRLDDPYISIAQNSSRNRQAELAGESACPTFVGGAGASACELHFFPATVHCIGTVTVALVRPPCDSTSSACG